MDKLTKILTNAVENSPYYSQFMPSQDDAIGIDCFPLLTKKILSEKKDSIIHRQYANPLIKECSIHLSSGTAGKPIEVYWHYNDEMQSNLSLWRLRAKYYNIRPTDRFCTLHTTNYSWNRVAGLEDIKYSKDKKILSLCKLHFDEDHLFRYYEEMMRFKPMWLFFQPSALIKITEFIIENNLTLPSSIRYIEFTGEHLTPIATNIVDDIYRCQYSNMYGTTETNAIAYRCPYGHLHVLNDNVFVEVQNEKDMGSNNGRIIVTSLTNNVFPLIRYDIGDLISISRDCACKCGITGSVITEIIGREQNGVILSSGMSVNENLFMSIFDRVNSVVGKKIMEYKVRVNSIDKSIDYIVHINKSDRPWEPKISDLLSRISSNEYEIDASICFTYEPIKIGYNGKYSIMETNY